MKKEGQQLIIRETPLKIEKKRLKKYIKKVPSFIRCANSEKNRIQRLLSFQIDELVTLIVKLTNKNRFLEGFIPMNIVAILLRALFECCIKQVILFLLPEDDGIKDYLSFSEKEELKIFISYQKNIKKMKTELPLYTEEDIKKFNKMQSEMRNYSNSLMDMSLLDLCKKLDDEYTEFIGIEEFFTLNYIQIYKFTCSSVHISSKALSYHSDESKMKLPFVGNIRVINNDPFYVATYLHYTSELYLVHMLVLSMFSKNVNLESFAREELKMIHGIGLNEKKVKKIFTGIRRKSGPFGL